MKIIVENENQIFVNEVEYVAVDAEDPLNCYDCAFYDLNICYDVTTEVNCGNHHENKRDDNRNISWKEKEV